MYDETWHRWRNRTAQHRNNHTNYIRNRKPQRALERDAKHRQMVRELATAIRKSLGQEEVP